MDPLAREGRLGRSLGRGNWHNAASEWPGYGANGRRGAFEQALGRASASGGGRSAQLSSGSARRRAKAAASSAAQRQLCWRRRVTWR